MFRLRIVCVLVCITFLSACEATSPSTTVSQQMPTTNTAMPVAIVTSSTRTPSPYRQPLSTSAPMAPTRTLQVRDEEAEAKRHMPRPATPLPSPSPSLTPIVTRLDDASIGVTSFSFADTRHGWLSYGTTILATDDGGATWTTRFKATNLVSTTQVGQYDWPPPISALDFISPQHGWAVIKDTLFATRDAGRSWEPVTNAPASLTHIDFVDSRVGWVGGGKDNKHFLSSTNDGGKTWLSVVDPCPFNDGYGSAAQFDFINIHTGWMLCFQGTGMTSGAYFSKQLFKTMDGGQQWHLLNETSYDITKDVAGQLPLEGAVSGLHFTDGNHGWTSDIVPGCQCSYIQYTADSGNSWDFTSWFPEERRLSNIRFLSARHAYALASHWHGSNVLVRTDDGGKTWKQLYPALFPTELPQFFDPTHGIAVGTTTSIGAILTTADGGHTWKQVAVLKADRVTGTHFTDAQHGCVVTEERHDNDATITTQQRTSNGGITWTPFVGTCVPPSREYTSPDEPTFVGPTHGWKLDPQGHLYATTDGGLSWTQLN